MRRRVHDVHQRRRQRVQRPALHHGVRDDGRGAEQLHGDAVHAPRDDRATLAPSRRKRRARGPRERVRVAGTAVDAAPTRRAVRRRDVGVLVGVRAEAGGAVFPRALRVRRTAASAASASGELAREPPAAPLVASGVGPRRGVREAHRVAVVFHERRAERHLERGHEQEREQERRRPLREALGERGEARRARDALEKTRARAARNRPLILTPAFYSRRLGHHAPAAALRDDPPPPKRRADVVRRDARVPVPRGVREIARPAENNPPRLARTAGGPRAAAAAVLEGPRSLGAALLLRGGVRPVRPFSLATRRRFGVFRRGVLRRLPLVARRRLSFFFRREPLSAQGLGARDAQVPRVRLPREPLEEPLGDALFLGAPRAGGDGRPGAARPRHALQREHQALDDHAEERALPGGANEPGGGAGSAGRGGRGGQPRHRGGGQPRRGGVVVFARGVRRLGGVRGATPRARPRLEVAAVARAARLAAVHDVVVALVVARAEARDAHAGGLARLARAASVRDRAREPDVRARRARGGGGRAEVREVRVVAAGVVARDRGLDRLAERGVWVRGDGVGEGAGGRAGRRQRRDAASFANRDGRNEATPRADVGARRDAPGATALNQSRSTRRSATSRSSRGAMSRASAASRYASGMARAPAREGGEID